MQVCQDHIRNQVACIYATYFKNRSPSRDKNVTSWEEWHGKKPNAKYYRVFRCSAFVQIPKEKKKNLSNKKWKRLFVGYHKNIDRIWKIWDPIDKKIKKATSFSFDGAFSNKNSKELLKFHGNDSDQKLDIETDTDSVSDDPKLTPPIQQPVSYLTLPLSSPPSSLLWPRSPSLPQLPQFA